MDIRDIRDEVHYPGKHAFEELFNLQLILVDHYTKIESLPPHPIDINTKDGQNLIKDFSARITEEFGEGFESYLIMLDMFHAGTDEKEMIPHLQNFNEEVADAIHFWLELMIFSGFGASTINNWMGNQGGSSAGMLEALLAQAKEEVLNDTHHKRFPARWVIKDHMLKDEFLRGGRLLGNERKDMMKQLLWDNTYWLQIARNTLKNKPWKQTGMMTDFKQYEDAIANCTFAMFKFFAFCGFTAEAIFTIYFKKNKINQFRISSRY